MKKARYKASEVAKLLRKKARRRRKGLQDKDQQVEGVMYAAGAFDAPSDPSHPGPSIQLGLAGAGRGRGKAGAGKGKEKAGAGRGKGMAGAGMGKGKAGAGDSGSSDFDESEYSTCDDLGSSDCDDPGPAKRSRLD